MMTTRLSKEPRRFAPLGGGGDNEVEGLPKLKGIVFDVDGTLWSVSIFVSLLLGGGFGKWSWCREVVASATIYTGRG
jgi:hypothetical protein